MKFFQNFSLRINKKKNILLIRKFFLFVKHEKEIVKKI